jgi:hypothetical protein
MIRLYGFTTSIELTGKQCSFQNIIRKNIPRRVRHSSVLNNWELWSVDKDRLYGNCQWSMSYIFGYVFLCITVTYVLAGGCPWGPPPVPFIPWRVSRYGEAGTPIQPVQTGTDSSAFVGYVGGFVGVVDWVWVAPTALLFFNHLCSWRLRARLFLQTLLQSFSTAWHTTTHTYIVGSERRSCRAYDCVENR